MSNRKYASGYDKLKKKRKIESLIQSQKGALEKIFTSSKRDINNSSIETLEQSNLKELGDIEVMVENPIEDKNDEICDGIKDNKEG